MRTLGQPLQILLWSYVFIYVVSCSLSITQVDLWWQLAEGDHILQTWNLPTEPAAAFGLPATPYFDEYAGYEVILALLFHCTGFVGLWFVFAAVYLSILFLPFTTTPQKYPAFDISSTFALLIAALLMRTRLEQRPELVGSLLQVLLMVLLRGANLEKINVRTLGWVFLVFLAWSNTHSTFVIGLFTLGLWILGETWTRFKTAPHSALLRNACLMGTTALFATMLNPYGARRLLFPFLQAFDPGSTALSQEMWPITDYSTAAGIFILLGLGALAWGILTTRGLSMWLVLFSIFSAVMTIKSFRFINFLAISVLFVYAARSIQAVKAPTSSWILALLRNTVLCVLIVFMLFGDTFNFLLAYQQLSQEDRLATHARRFASDIVVELPEEKGPGRIPILCGHGIGSYLSFEGNGHFRPLLDSGLSHFSDDTKRYFFFLWHEPAAFDLVLAQLRVDRVLINKETFPWIPTVHRLPNWQLVVCTANGTLWTRNSGGAHPLSDADRAKIADAVNVLQSKGSLADAFDYSTLLDDPVKSLAIIAAYSGPEWSEAFFNSLCAWVDSVPRGDIQAFLAGDHPRQYPLLDAILSARMGPQTYDSFMATHPTGPRPWFWKVIEVRELLQKGDREQARAVFETISPVPLASTTYYELWQQVPHAAEPSAYGRWQTWDDDGKKFLGAMSTRLNARITSLDSSPAR